VGRRSSRKAVIRCTWICGQVPASSINQEKRTTRAVRIQPQLPLPSVLPPGVAKSPIRANLPLVSATGIGPDVTGKAAGGRRLIAVVYADMVGYSRLISLDDAGTLRRLRTLRRALIDPAIREHGGQVVQTGGDSLLVAFDSIDGAVRCAVKVQQQVPVYDGDQPPAWRIRFRIGINIGDVIPHGTDLHGDGVNIAARLQAECPVGGICVSRTVRDHVHGRLDLPFEPIGELTLKNIVRPVEAFVVRLDPAGLRLSAVAATPWQRWRRTSFAIIATLLLLVGAGVGAWRLSGDASRTRTTAAPSPGPAPTAPSLVPQEIGLSSAPRLSIVILPFENLSGDPKDDYLAEGITDDLTTELSNIANAFVIARNSAYTYKGKAVNVKQVGDQLGVRYVLEGSMRRLGDVLRVNAQLVSAETGAHLWADRFDEPVRDLAAGQEEIVTRIGNALGWEMVRIEAVRSVRERPDNPDAFDLILRARSLWLQPFNLDRLAEIRALYERAVQLDPSSSRAKTGLAYALMEQAADEPGGTTEDLLTRAASLISAAESLNANSYEVLSNRAYLLRVQKRWQEEMAVAQRMIDLYPNNQDGYNELANVKMITGAAEEAIPLFQKAIRIDPRSAFLFNRYRRIGYCLLVLGREQASIEWLQRSLASNPDAPAEYRAWSYRHLAAAYALIGRSDEARQTLAEANRLWPYATIRSQSPEDYSSEAAAEQIRHLREGLRLAGLRDHASEDADFGVPSYSKLQRGIVGYSPTSAPRVITIRTADLVPFLAQSRPLVIDTMLNTWGRSIFGAIGLRGSGIGGDFSDYLQDRLRRKMQTLTKGNVSSPVVVVGWSSERFDGYNLALRLAALGYTKVYWYRGGREAWEVAALPETTVVEQDW
jgi:adenylate cyclase